MTCTLATRARYRRWVEISARATTVRTPTDASRSPRASVPSSVVFENSDATNHGTATATASSTTRMRRSEGVPVGAEAVAVSRRQSTVVPDEAGLAATFGSPRDNGNVLHLP